MQDGDYIVRVKDSQIDQSVSPRPYEPGGDGMFTFFGFDLFWPIIVIAVLAIAYGTIVIVRQQTAKVIELLGKFSKVATAGFNLKFPVVERVVGEVDLRVKEMSKSVSAKTKDNSFLNIPVKVQYQVIAEKVREAFYTLKDPEDQMESYVTNIVRSTVSAMTMGDVFENRQKIEADVQDTLAKTFGEFGYAIVNVLVDNPMPSEEVIRASNRVVASEREKEAAVNEASAIKVKTVAQAEAEAESLTLKAKAYVEQRKLMADFYKGLDPEETAILSGIDYRDMVRDAAEKGSIILVPSTEAGNNMGQLIGAIEGAKGKPDALVYKVSRG